MRFEINKPFKVDKPWGHELWVHNNEEYCGKLLVFPKEQSKFSMHYHIIKKESWYVQEGQFKFDWIDSMSDAINDYGVKEAIIEKLQEEVDIDNLENDGGEIE